MQGSRLILGDCQLHTAWDGDPGGEPVLILHDRYGDLQSARLMGQVLGDSVLRIAVRSARLQTVGGAAEPQGYFWYVGPVDAPELSSLGDGLHQLEKLFIQSVENHGGKVSLFGKGEGGVMALLLAMIWPECVGRLSLVDTPFPRNMERIPVGARELAGLECRISNSRDDPEDLIGMLRVRGAILANWTA